VEWSWEDIVVKTTQLPWVLRAVLQGTPKYDVCTCAESKLRRIRTDSGYRAGWCGREFSIISKMNDAGVLV